MWQNIREMHCLTLSFRYIDRFSYIICLFLKFPQIGHAVKVPNYSYSCIQSIEISIDSCHCLPSLDAPILPLLYIHMAPMCLPISLEIFLLFSCFYDTYSCMLFIISLSATLFFLPMRQNKVVFCPWSAQLLCISFLHHHLMCQICPLFARNSNLLFHIAVSFMCISM